MRSARSWSIPRKFFDFLVGYRRMFPSLSEASAFAVRYIELSHVSPANIERQIKHGLAARPSDYPVLFFMEKLASQVSTLLDLGGNVGNLFYCYSKYLDLPPNFVWSVYDLAPTLEFGRRLADERGEHRLRFTGDLATISGQEVLLVSGSLHYLELPLPDLLRPLYERPKHVIINRTPMTAVKSVVTVQDAGDSLYACKTIHRAELVAGMEELGYELVDRWTVPELAVHIPFYPEYSVPEYTGVYFRLKTVP